MAKGDELRARAKRFALDAIELCQQLPTSDVGRVIVRQLLRSATSTGANLRAAHLAKSDADMVNKLKIAEEECDESAYWLELLQESGFEHASLARLHTEAGELFKIIAASIRTVRARAAASHS